MSPLDQIVGGEEGATCAKIPSRKEKGQSICGGLASSFVLSRRGRYSSSALQQVPGLMETTDQGAGTGGL